MTEYQQKPPQSYTCPVCFRREPSSRRLVCGDCVHNDIEILRNSVMENEALNDTMRLQINLIFQVCGELNRKQKTSSINDLVATLHNDENSRIPKPSYLAIRRLALNLQRLEALRQGVRAQSIQKAEKSVRAKIDSLQTRIETTMASIRERTALVESKKNQIADQFTKKHLAIKQEVVLNNEATTKIARQTVLWHHFNYQIIRDYAFSNLDAYSSRGQPNPKFLLFKKPVLPLSSFLQSPIISVNTFLEDLIRLLVMLYDLFKLVDDTLELPYLNHLKAFLPDSKFYDSVQDKINIILRDNQSTASTEQNGDETEHEVFSEPPPALANENLDKVTVKDSNIHVPVSSRTANMQRRTSYQSPANSETPEPERRGRESSSSDVLSEKGGIAGPLKASPLKSSTQGQSERHLVGSKSSSPTTHNSAIPQGSEVKIHGYGKDLSGKNIVIVPHKILTKPFSKLKSREYLKFVSIVVKILFSYNTFLQKICEGASSEVELSKSISSSRSLVVSKLASSMDSEVFFDDFHEVLSLTANLEYLFQHKKKNLAIYANQSQSFMNSSKNADSLQWSNNTDISSTSYISQSSESATSKQGITTNENTVMRGIYERFLHFGHDIMSKREPKSYASKNIYGDISETSFQGSSMQGKGNSTRKAGDSRTKFPDPTTPGNNDTKNDIQKVMKKVHDKLSGRGRVLGKASREMSSTLSMMEQSREQLEEWDVVSKIY